MEGKHRVVPPSGMAMGTRRIYEADVQTTCMSGNCSYATISTNRSSLIPPILHARRRLPERRGHAPAEQGALSLCLDSGLPAATNSIIPHPLMEKACVTGVTQLTPLNGRPASPLAQKKRSQTPQPTFAGPGHLRNRVKCTWS